jgi:hypothetical protein
LALILSDWNVTPSKEPVPNLHFKPLHEAASHFTELNGPMMYYETHGEGRPRCYYTAAGTANVPRFWQPPTRRDGAALSRLLRQ